MSSGYDTYVSPLAQRNASPEMLRLWSARHKFQLWRRIWLAVAEAQHELGLPVTREQVEELRGAVKRGIGDEEIRRAEEHERRLRHDVMAHVHTLGEACPKARPIIHLGMTSQDVNDNTELRLLDEALWLLTLKVTQCVLAVGTMSERWRSTPALAFTHFQAAQPTTVGRRAAQWAYELFLCHERMSGIWSQINGTRRGLRGATGTQASYLELVGGTGARVDELEARMYIRLEENHGFPETDTEAFAQKIRRAHTFNLVTQTYPRVIDAFVLSDLAATAAVLHKIATDIRLLANRKELDEPFETDQIGSSAMPYKRNPMRCERICGLARFVMNLVGNAYDTAATQWLERTLDDSSNRRLSLPEAFLALDGALDLMHNVASGLIVHEATVRANLMAELPFMATENIMMAAVKIGRDRQDVHEAIRRHAQEAGRVVKDEGKPNDLLDRLRAEPLLAGVDIDAELDPARFIGRAPEQVDRFLKEVVEPLREQYAERLAAMSASEPRV